MTCWSEQLRCPQHGQNFHKVCFMFVSLFAMRYIISSSNNITSSRFPSSSHLPSLHLMAGACPPREALPEIFETLAAPERIVALSHGIRRPYVL